MFGEGYVCAGTCPQGQKHAVPILEHHNGQELAVAVDFGADGGDVGCADANERYVPNVIVPAAIIEATKYLEATPKWGIPIVAPHIVTRTLLLKQSLEDQSTPNSVNDALIKAKMVIKSVREVLHRDHTQLKT